MYFTEAVIPNSHLILGYLACFHALLIQCQSTSQEGQFLDETPIYQENISQFRPEQQQQIQPQQQHSHSHNHHHQQLQEQQQDQMSNQHEDVIHQNDILRYLEHASKEDIEEILQENPDLLTIIMSRFRNGGKGQHETAVNHHQVSTQDDAPYEQVQSVQQTGNVPNIAFNSQSPSIDSSDQNTNGPHRSSIAYNSAPSDQILMNVGGGNGPQFYPPHGMGPNGPSFNHTTGSQFYHGGSNYQGSPPFVPLGAVPPPIGGGFHHEYYNEYEFNNDGVVVPDKALFAYLKLKNRAHKFVKVSNGLKSKIHAWKALNKASKHEVPYPLPPPYPPGPIGSPLGYPPNPDVIAHKDYHFHFDVIKTKANGRR